jgi:hypothetical protein
MSRDAGGTVVAAFQTDEDAERALERLTSSGIEAGDISVVPSDPAPHSRVGVDAGSNVLAAGGIGALFGAIMGGAAAWFLALGTMGLPGTGPYSGIGSIASSATGGLLGAIMGGLVGALVGLRIPASPEAEGDTGGRILVTVRTPAESDTGRVEEVLATNGGRDVRSAVASGVWTPGGSDVTAPTTVDTAAPEPTPLGLGDFSGLQAIARQEEEPDMHDKWMGGDAPENSVPGDDDATNTEEEVLQDVEASSGETGWYESLRNPPVAPAANVGEATGSGLTEDEETWADIASMQRQEESDLNDNPEGTNEHTATGTQGAINPDTGTFGTAGTPVTAGHGVSGSTIGTGTAAGEQATQSGEFQGATPDTANYDRGGRASTDSQQSAQPDERDATVEDKYARVDSDAAPIQQDPGTVDVYEAGPSYGPGTREEVDRTDLYASSDVDTAPTYANTPTDDANTSSGTDIPGTADPRGLGDNTDDQS